MYWVLDASLWELSMQVQPVEVTGADPEHAGGKTHPIWPKNASGSPRKSWRMWPGRSNQGYLAPATRWT